MTTDIPQSKPASQADAGAALAVLFDAMPYPPRMNADTALAAYLLALQGMSLESIEAGIAKFMRGECADVSQKYAPTPPELARICRTAIVRERIPEKQQIAPPPKPRNWKAPFEIKMEKERQRFAGWKSFAKNISHMDFRTMSQQGDVPVGAVWSAMLGEIFLPPPGHPIGTGPSGQAQHQRRLDFEQKDIDGL